MVAMTVMPRVAAEMLGRRLGVLAMSRPDLRPFTPRFSHSRLQLAQLTVPQHRAARSSCVGILLMAEIPRALVTNDDGIDSPGPALRREAHDLPTAMPASRSIPTHTACVSTVS